MLIRVWGYKNPYAMHNVDWFSYSGEQFGTTLFTQRICIEHVLF